MEYHKILREIFQKYLSRARNIVNVYVKFYTKLYGAGNTVELKIKFYAKIYGI